MTMETDTTRRMAPLVLSVAGGMVLMAAILLWAHYGTAVFLEMIRAGYATCFG
jgi:hypothetical protein